jgi:hypothetical protein
MPNVFNAGNVVKQLIWTRVKSPLLVGSGDNGYRNRYIRALSRGRNKRE